MTVGQLRDILAKLDPELRVLIPGQEWGWADLERGVSRTVTFAPIDERPDMGAWTTQRLRDADGSRERCILLKPRPSGRRRPRA
jgi:hypothetical protein